MTIIEKMSLTLMLVVMVAAQLSVWEKLYTKDSPAELTVAGIIFSVAAVVFIIFK